jgi:hypothetical protein
MRSMRIDERRERKGGGGDDQEMTKRYSLEQSE